MRATPAFSSTQPYWCSASSSVWRQLPQRHRLVGQQLRLRRAAEVRRAAVVRGIAVAGTAERRQLRIALLRPARSKTLEQAPDDHRATTTVTTDDDDREAEDRADVDVALFVLDALVVQLVGRIVDRAG